MRKHYYIHFDFSTESSFDNINYISLQRVSDIKIAEFIIELYYNDKFFLLNKRYIYMPVLITNDERLYKKYKNVYSEKDFYAFSITAFKPDIEKLDIDPYIKLIAVNSAINRLFNRELYHHFKLIIQGKCNKAIMLETANYDYDYETGKRYDFAGNIIWKTSNDIIDFKEIEKYLDSGEINEYIKFKEKEKLVSNNDYIWWENLSIEIKTHLKDRIYEHITEDIPTLEFLIKLKNIKSINLNSINAKISDIEFISFFKNLKELNCSNMEIKNLNALSELTHLESLDCSNNYIESIEPLKNLINLNSLNCNNNVIKDIEGLRNLTKLQYLSLNNNNISNINSLENLVKLEKLDVSFNKILCVGSLSKLTNLYYLNLENNLIENIFPLSDLINLKELYLSKNKLKDITSLEKLIRLEVYPLQKDSTSEINKKIETIVLINNFNAFDK